MKTLFPFVFFCFVIISCTKKSDLPQYGGAVIPGDYVNQLGESVDSTIIQDKVAVIDFVFTHCPSICPTMALQMKRIQEEYGSTNELQLLSFSIDPKHDTVDRLRWYTEKIGVNDSTWYFLRANQETIDSTSQALKIYQEADETAPGGINHASTFILVDKNNQIRGYYDGTNSIEVDQLIRHMKSLF